MHAAGRAAAVKVGECASELKHAMVPACYLDAWARLQCQRPLSVAGAALLRTGRDSWSGEDWRAFFDERAGIAEFDGGLPRLEG